MNKITVFLIAVMATSFTSAAHAADRSAQMMRERNIPPSVLADRIERECVHAGVIDPACKPSGANATVSDFVAAINANPEGTRYVASPKDLPRFLRGLHSRQFTGEQCLSGMNGTDVAAYCRNVRGPHPGEVAWWAGDTFVLAGDCLNARVGYKATPLPPVTVQGVRWQRPADRSFAPFANESEQCSQETVRLTGVHVFTERAYETDCAQRYVHNPSRYGTGRGRVGSYVATGSEDVFSLRCGKELHDAQRAGAVPFSTQNHRVELLLVRNDGAATPIFSGTVRGNVLSPASDNDALLLTEDRLFVDVPSEFQEGFLVWNFPDGGMISPTESGAGMDVRRLESSSGCHRKVKVASAIEGGGDGFAYGQ